MKTAISIPDEVFDGAEVLSQRMGISRSELYTKAIGSFMKKHLRKGITEELNKVYPGQDSRLDPILGQLQSASLGKETW